MTCANNIFRGLYANNEENIQVGSQQLTPLVQVNQANKSLVVLDTKIVS